MIKKILIKKILIANRGEIAIRVMRTCKEMGILTVAVYSDTDKDSLHVRFADQAIHIGGSQAADSYLNQDNIIAAAHKTGADAIHPGYGFLSENASFSQRCADEGIIFIGPAPAAIRSMGMKDEAKKIAIAVNVPVIPDYNGDDQSPETMLAEVQKIGFPVLVKAVAGGGGKGMRIVHQKEKFFEAVESASREALKSFGDGRLLIEKYIASAKHIEFQVFGDQHGNHIHLFERECSVQRRFQKIFEESPSPALTPELRSKMGEAAVAIVKHINYTNAGTVEFLLDETGHFYFLEVNTRLQVEHPVTEEVTGLDLVRLQIEVSQGMPLNVKTEDLCLQGHSIECRVYAEDPMNNFFPSTGEIKLWHQPVLPGLRYENGVTTSSKVDVYYDPMVAKIIATGQDRHEAIRKLHTALSKFSVAGITTNRDFLMQVLEHPEFVAGTFDTRFLDKHFGNYSSKKPSENQLRNALVAALLIDYHFQNMDKPNLNLTRGWRNSFNQNQSREFEWAGEKHRIEYKTLDQNILNVVYNNTETTASLQHIICDVMQCMIDDSQHYFTFYYNEKTVFIQDLNGIQYVLNIVPRFTEPKASEKTGGYKAPLPGEIVKIMVKVGDTIKLGDPLLIMSSMKMETTIESVSNGLVEAIFVEEKGFVQADTVLLNIVVVE